MNRPTVIGGVVLFFAGLIAATAASAVQKASVDTHAIDAIFGQWNTSNTPGCALSVEHKGEPLLTRSYGSADLEHDVAITPATIFEAGSVTKQFTAASILILAEQRKLALTDDARRYIPELPDYGTPITINELLGHTSGLRDWGDVEAIAGWPRGSRIYTLDDVLDVTMRQKSLNYRPGTAYSYTNTGFNLLAIIVERVSKESLAEFSKKQMFEPLGMSHTQWRDDFRRVVKGRAIAYGASGDGFVQSMPFEDDYGNGGLLTTVGDLQTWNDALTEGKLGQYVTTELQRRTKLDNGREIAYARGLFVRSYHGVREISHSGSTGGYKAWLGRYPDQRLSIALLCNAGNAAATKLAHQVADLFLPMASPQTSIKLTAAQLAPHVGLFVDERMGLPEQLDMHGDSLRFDGDDLVATSPEEFRTGSAKLRLIDNDRFVLQTDDGDVLGYRRVQAWSPTHIELAALSGLYTSDEALASYRVSMTKDGSVVLVQLDRHGQALRLKPIFADTFDWGDYDDGIVHFTRDRQDRVSGFQMSTSRAHAVSFHRIDEGS